MISANRAQVPSADLAREKWLCSALQIALPRATLRAEVEKVLSQTRSLRHTPSRTVSLRPPTAGNSRWFQGL